MYISQERESAMVSHASRNARRVLVVGLLFACALVVMLANATTARAALSTAQCITCHGDTTVHANITCVGSGCHGSAEHGTGLVAFSASDHVGEACTAYCHSALVPAPGVAHPDEGAAAHGAATVEPCASCHDSGLVSLHAACASCHTTPPPPGATCATCHPAYTTAHGAGPFLKPEFANPAQAGYLDWNTASTFPGNSGTSPHGGYTANTNKCAVCHSVHTAKVGGSVLTAGGPYATYAQGCVFCHGVGNTFTDVVMTANADGYISPHGTCARCHALNPHGVGTSEYVTLASKLINKNADVAIGTDLSVGNNGLTVSMFNGMGTAGELAAGATLGTGYLCGGCHNQSFAVNTPGFDPASTGTFTGHRVTAMATAAWTPATYGAAGAFTTPANVMTIAWKNANSCQACHDAKTVAGSPAFPHGYVNAAGAATPKTASGSSFIWLTTGDSATTTPTVVLGKIVPETGDGNTNLLTEDGLCLKCHRSGTGSGVGLTY